MHHPILLNVEIFRFCSSCLREPVDRARIRIYTCLIGSSIFEHKGIDTGPCNRNPGEAGTLQLELILIQLYHLPRSIVIVPETALSFLLVLIPLRNRYV